METMAAIIQPNFALFIPGGQIYSKCALWKIGISVFVHVACLFLHTLYANFVHFACYSSKSALVEGLFNVITRMWIMSMKLIVAIKYTSHVHELLNPSYFHMALIQVWYGPVPVSLGEIPHETLTKSRMPQMTWYLPYHTRNSVFDCDDGMMSSQASRILLKVVVLTHPLVVYRPSSNSQVLLNSLSL